MDAIDPAWRLVDESPNVWFYEVEPAIFAVVPKPDTVDDRESALVNVKILNAHPGCVLGLFDSGNGQDSGARAVYRDHMDPKQFGAIALVGGTLMGRAMGNFFIRLSRVPIRMQLFGKVAPALAWLRNYSRTPK
jgi:hypothetical protein